MDILLSLIGIGLTLPIIVAAIIAIRLESPGPAFYIQKRVGYRGRRFKLIKLRSMLVGAEKIGPRPEQPVFTTLFNKKIANFNIRLLVKPGLTGWAQINGGYELSPEEKLNKDLYYIQYISFIFDMKILFKTIFVILSGKGAR